jgi:hypothetical protein
VSGVGLPAVGLLAVALSAAAAFGQGSGGSGGSAGGPGGKGWVSRLPADAWALAGYDGRPLTGPALGTTPLSKVLAEPASVRYSKEVVDPLIAGLRKMALERLPAPVAEAAETFLDVVRTRRVSLAVLPPKPGAGGPPIPQFLVSLDPGDRAADLKKAWPTLEATVVAAVSPGRPGAGPKVEPRKIGDLELRTVRPPPGGPVPVVTWGFVGDELILAVGEDAEALAFAGKAPEKPLYADPDFLALGKGVRGEAKDGVILLTWVNVAAIRAFAEGFAPPPVKAALEATGLASVKAVAESMRIEGGDFRTTTLIATADGPAGLFKAFAGPKIEADTFGRVPRSVRHVISKWAAPDEAIKTAEAVAKAAGLPWPPPEAGRLLAEVDEVIGEDLRKEAPAALAGRYTVLGYPDDAIIYFGGATVLVDFRDPAKGKAWVEKATAKLKEWLEKGNRERRAAGGFGPFANAEYRLSVREFLGHPVHSVNLFGVAPAWVATERGLVVGPTAQSVMDYLAAVDRKGAGSLNDNADFASRLKALGFEPELLVYTDLPAWWPDAHAALTIAAFATETGLRFGSGPGGPPLPVKTVRPELFPSLSAVAPHAKGVILAAGWDKATLRIETVAPFPVPPPAAGFGSGSVVGGAMAFLTYRMGPPGRPRPFPGPAEAIVPRDEEKRPPRDERKDEEKRP